MAGCFATCLCTTDTYGTRCASSRKFVSWEGHAPDVLNAMLDNLRGSGSRDWTSSRTEATPLIAGANPRLPTQERKADRTPVHAAGRQSLHEHIVPTPKMGRRGRPALFSRLVGFGTRGCVPGRV